VMNFTTYYGYRMVVTLFKTTCHMSICEAKLVQSTPSHNIPLKSFLILSSHLGLKNSLMFSHRKVKAFLFSLTCATCPSCVILFEHRSRDCIVRHGAMFCNTPRPLSSFRMPGYVVLRSVKTT